MSWTEPLAMQEWMINILSGTPEIFTAVALMFIAGLAGYFRMRLITLFLMIGIFLLMFGGFINSPLIILIGLIGGLLVGITLSRIFGQ
jgi:hypothetical protein